MQQVNKISVPRQRERQGPVLISSSLARLSACLQDRIESLSSPCAQALKWSVLARILAPLLNSQNTNHGANLCACKLWLRGTRSRTDGAHVNRRIPLFAASKFLGYNFENPIAICSSFRKRTGPGMKMVFIRK